VPASVVFVVPTLTHEPERNSWMVICDPAGDDETVPNMVISASTCG
jgi:hypothetical protein